MIKSGHHHQQQQQQQQQPEHVLNFSNVFNVIKNPGQLHCPNKVKNRISIT
jgi:hypothetical protein